MLFFFFFFLLLGSDSVEIVMSWEKNYCDKIIVIFSGLIQLVIESLISTIVPLILFHTKSKNHVI